MGGKRLFYLNSSGGICWMISYLYLEMTTLKLTFSDCYIYKKMGTIIRDTQVLTLVYTCKLDWSLFNVCCSMC